ncbi:MAG: hypothetical protein ACK5IC_03040 [Moheibacter sp.]
MKRLLLSSLFAFVLSGGMTFAQNFQSLKIDSIEIENSGIILSSNWIPKIENYTILRLSNGRINNQSSNKTYKNLNLSVILISSDSIFTKKSIDGYRVSSIDIKKLKKSSNLVGLNIVDQIDDLPPSGKYQPMIVISRNNGTILDYQLLDETLEVRNNQITIIEYTEEESGQEKSSTIEIPEIYHTEKLNLLNDNACSLEREWKVEIDFKNFMVNAIGGDISNNTSNDFRDVVLNIYLTNGETTSSINNFNGLLISSAKIQNLKAEQRFVNVKVKTNLLNIPKNDTYTILMVLSTMDESGNLVVRSRRSFPNTITF